MIDAADILTLFEFADTDILNVRPVSETVDDLVNWTLELRTKFEKRMA